MSNLGGWGGEEKRRFESSCTLLRVKFFCIRQTYYSGLASAKKKYKIVEIWLHVLKKVTKFYAMHIAKVCFTVKPSLEFQHSKILEKRQRSRTVFHKGFFCSVGKWRCQWHQVYFSLIISLISFICKQEVLLHCFTEGQISAANGGGNRHQLWFSLIVRSSL